MAGRSLAHSNLEYIRGVKWLAFHKYLHDRKQVLAKLSSVKILNLSRGPTSMSKHSCMPVHMLCEYTEYTIDKSIFYAYIYL